MSQHLLSDVTLYTNLPAAGCFCLSLLQQHYFHPCEWDDHSCHKELAMQRALGTVNLTRWVLYPCLHVLPLDSNCGSHCCCCC